MVSQDLIGGLILGLILLKAEERVFPTVGH